MVSAHVHRVACNTVQALTTGNVPSGSVV